jgi:hypothetical protein
MSYFPLYENLIQELPTKDLTQKQKDEFVKNILKIDTNGMELIYALIHFYFISHENDNITEVPYNGTKTELENHNYDVSWEITQFPIKLRQLLYKFVSMHIKNVTENPNRGTIS